jgi:hypothetical protein
MNLSELAESWLPCGPDEGVGQAGQKSCGSIAVDVAIRAGEVAQRSLQPKGLRLEEEPLVIGRAPAGRGDGQADLEWHVESRCPAGSLDSTQVVKGVPAGRHQLQDSIQSSRWPGDLERGARPQAEPAETCYKRKEQRLIASVVRHIQEGVVGGVPLGDRLAPARYAPTRRGPTLGVTRGVRCHPIPLSAAAASAELEILRDHRSELPQAPVGNTENASGLGRRRVGCRDQRTGFRGHGPLYAAQLAPVNVSDGIRTDRGRELSPEEVPATPVLKGTPQEYMTSLGQTVVKVFPISPGDRLESR